MKAYAGYGASELLEMVVVPVCEELCLPIALKLGAWRGMAPDLEPCCGGDGVANADVASLQALCGRFPKVKFLVTAPRHLSIFGGRSSRGAEQGEPARAHGWELRCEQLDVPGGGPEDEESAPLRLLVVRCHGISSPKRRGTATIPPSSRQIGRFR